jgi:predicted anti-sigma-YlaC factor YlaD
VRTPHPTPSEILDLCFGEVPGGRGARIEAHLRECPGCREARAAVEWVDRSLAALPEAAPPADGLERGLERIAVERPGRAARAGWLLPLAATLGGVAAGAGAIYAVGSRILASMPSASGPLLESARVASGFGLAALVFFAAGSFVTLALAPALLMEAQSRARALAAR